MNPIKRTFLIIFLSIAGLIVLAMSIAFFKKDEIREFVVKSINEKLTTKVEVGDISFSILSNFPYATVRFENVIVHENKTFITTGQVLNAEKISFLFSLGSIFSKEYILKKIVITNANLNLQIDNEGRNNYDIWKKSDNDSTKSDSLQLQLQDVILENVDVLYYNNLKNQDIDFLVRKGSFKGDFKSNSYLLSADAELEKTSIVVEKINYLSSVNCHTRISMEINKTNGTYTFRDSELRLADLVLKVDGLIKDSENYLEMNLKISSPSADLPSLLSLIPEKYSGGTSGFNYSGKIEFNGTITGRSGKKFSPVVAFNFKSINVNLNPDNTPYHLKNMNGNGFFTNSKNKTVPVSYLKLENFSATLEGKPIKINLEIENFKKPKVKLHASGEADLLALSKFYKPDTFNEIAGKLFADIEFNGIADEKTTYQSSGSVRFENVNFRIKKKPITFNGFNGLIHLRGNDVMVENLSGVAGNSDFNLQGSFNNLMAFLLLENQKLNIIASVQSNRVDLDELMANDVSSNQNTDTIYKIHFSEKLKFQADLVIGELRFKKFQADGIRGNIAMESKVLFTKDLEFKTAGGTVRLKGTIDNRPINQVLINYDALVNKLDINNLFFQMGNFGQEVLVDKNLKGVVSAEVQFRSAWNERLELDENSIYAKSDITIENGELINFEPMLALSRFLKGADLKTIKFSTLTNTIEIKKRKILIPLMEIKSSALDITASGEHSFDNIVDYKLRLYLSQILGKKVKQQNTEFGTIEDDGLGRTMVYLNMKGPVSSPKFEWDRKGVEKKSLMKLKTKQNLLKPSSGKSLGKKTL